jgi:two-component system, chemotaxis family, CheB/CheR fusion protein
MNERPISSPAPHGGNGVHDERGALQESHALPICPVVGIGASAGGVKALQALFESLPEDLNAAFVVILHLDPSRPSDLPHILAGRTSMPVTQVAAATTLEPRNVYVIPPDRRLLISDHQVATAEFDEPRGRRLPIDHFFRSLAAERGDGVAIVLTGAGADGAIGIKAVKDAGGVILVQDPREAEYPSMPSSAIATGAADFVLPVHQMGARLFELLRRKQQLRRPEAGLEDEEILRRIMGLVRQRTGHDFSGYKRATVLRRLARRMQIVRSDRLRDYCKYLEQNVEEAQALYSDLLISVTSFFRDPDAFEVLAREVIPKLFDARTEDDAIRAWVPGCATGEEAYSIAMLLLEESARRDVRPQIQVFASDLDAGALATAREGRYPVTIEADVSDERLRRFFSRQHDLYQVNAELRSVVLFATHSLLRDPPFSRLDLASCRNLLIYLDRDLQRQACNTLAYALSPGGYLFLGSAEGVDDSHASLRLIHRQARIYQSTGRAAPAVPHVLKSDFKTTVLPLATYTPRDRSSGRDALGTHRQALEKLAPPSILVDDACRVLNLSESAGQYLLHPGGPPTSDVTELVRPELRLDLRSGLHRAFDLGERSLSSPIAVQFDRSVRQVYLQVRPIASKDGPLGALVLFIEGEPVPAPASEHSIVDSERGAVQAVRQLREELNATGERLRQSQEQYHGAIEELRAANEELQSTNEEYRSAGEELEISREELQSANEELRTVNNELRLKLDLISRAHSDIENLISSSEVGTLFLDPELRIKRFTPRVARLFNIVTGDEGRPITDFTHHLEYQQLESDAREILDRLTPIEREIKSEQGSWYLVTLRPYRTEERLDGVVVTFVDVTSRRRAEDELRESVTRLKLAREAAGLGILDYDTATQTLWMDERCRELWGLGQHEPVTMESLWARMHPGDLPQFRAVWDAALSAKTGSSYAAEFRTLAGPPQRWLRANGKVFFTETAPGRPAERIVVTVQDVSAHKAQEARQKFLLGELSHRVKNTMAVAQSLARQTLGKSGASEQALQAFEGRLAALSRSHELLMQHDWGGSSVREMAESQLSVFAAADAQRIAMCGPQVILAGHLTTGFALLIHELATNAVKHGALSQPDGRIAVSWRVKQQAGLSMLEFEWRESGMKRVETPHTQGFGTFLIERGVPEAKVVREFRPEGLLCTVELPLRPAG